MLIPLLLLTTLFANVAADGYNCPKTSVINSPKDLSKPYYYPDGWNEKMQPEKYAGSQDCNWTFNIPQGMFATVTFYKNTDSETGIHAIYPNGQEEYLQDNDKSPYIFTSPKFQVTLNVGAEQGEFSFKVIWSKYPPACLRSNTLTDSGASASYASQCVTTYIAPNRAVLVGFSLKDNSYALLRQTAVYEGDSVNGNYLGNLFDARYGQIMAKGNKLTIYTFGLYEKFNYTLYMGMDIKATADIKTFTGLNCPYDPTIECKLPLNSQNGVSAIATVGRQPDFLKQFSYFPKGVTLKIYEDQISDSNLIATVDQSNYETLFPMAVKTSLKIYHLDSGFVSIPLTNNAADAKYNTVYEGRYVNVHSLDYRRTSFTQDTSEVFQTEQSQKLYFKFNIKYFDVNGPTTLDIKVSRDGKLIYGDTFNKYHLPPSNTTIKIFGDKMEIDYKTYGNYTRGFEVDFLTTKNV